MLVLGPIRAEAGKPEGIAACGARDWDTAARELAGEEAATTDPAVIRCLADMYLSGRGLPEDPERAFQLWRRLADHGDDEAEDMIGYFYLNGIGIRRDPAQSEIFFLRSATQGNQTAMSELALYYSLGFFGCCPEPQKALQWTRKLADLGNRQAQIDLLRAYARGEGVARDDAEAVAWARKAALQGSPEACLFLGYASEQGRGTAKNLVEAYKWFSLAALPARAPEAAEAARERDRLGAALSTTQLDEAQGLTLEWRIRNPQN
jgi:uncharacterized protein